MAQKTSKQVIEVFCGARSRGWQKHCEHYKGCCDEYGWKCAHEEGGFCNFKAPIYTPAKPDNVKEGYYWLVTPNTENTIERIWDGYNNGVLGMETVDGMWITVEEIYEWGGMLYRVPELEGEK